MNREYFGTPFIFLIMLYSVTKPLSHELINTYVSDYDIISHYWETGFDVGKTYNSPFREDHNPSFGVIKNGTGALIWNDLATGDSGNAITFVKNKLNLDSYKASLDRIYKDLILQGHRTPEDILKPLKSKEKGLKKDIGVKRQKLTQIDIDYWIQFGITPEVLKTFNVDSIKYFFINDLVYWAYVNDNPMYSYKVYDKYKIYRPKANKKDKWQGNLTKNYVFGYKQLPKTGDLLIITKSLKDVMMLYTMGYNAISPCSEGTLLPSVVVEDIKTRFKNIIVIYDNDEAGIKSAKKMNDKYQFKTVVVPEESGEKDLTDYYVRYGKVNTSILLEALFGNEKKD